MARGSHTQIDHIMEKYSVQVITVFLVFLGLFDKF